MKKITTLLLLCTVASSSALAQTKPDVNTGGEAYAKAYVVGSYNRGGFLTQKGSSLKHTSQSAYNYWFLTDGTAENSVKFINVRTGKGIATDFSVGDNAADLYVLPNGVNNKGLSISNASTLKDKSCIDASNQDDGCGQYKPITDDWDGTTWCSMQHRVISCQPLRDWCLLPLSSTTSTQRLSHFPRLQTNCVSVC